MKKIYLALALVAFTSTAQAASPLQTLMKSFDAAPLTVKEAVLNDICNREEPYQYPGLTQADQAIYDALTPPLIDAGNIKGNTLHKDFCEDLWENY